MSRSNLTTCCALILLSAIALLQPAHADDAATWAALVKGGNVVLIRHASTESGIGDPPDFSLDKCSSQRNLSAEGRAQAQRLGEQFRQRAIPVARVLSSRWCRCVDTAMLAFGQAIAEPMLDSSFNDSAESARKKNREVAAAIRRHAGGGNLVMVTHQVNIAGLTGAWARSGEVVVVSPAVGKDGKLAVVGRLQLD
ncbi:MAG: histidine phosphatase family protein [Burkholderiaceae bacterium]